MDLATIEVERPKAREAFVEYRKAVREARKQSLTQAQRLAAQSDEEMMRGYRELMHGRQLISMTQTLRSAGLVDYKTQDGGSVNLPAMAVVPVTKSRVLVEVTAEGTVTFAWGDGGFWRTNSAQRLRFPGVYEPASRNPWIHRRFAALVPMVPPALRPPRGLGLYHVLFEAEWKETAPPAPRDPALVRHIGGDLWAVMAIWDLTELERTVLTGRRSDA